jgi:outer membrane protein assembly factor BamD (BamD/ComL family)
MKKILFILTICLFCSISVFSQSKRTWEKTQSLNSITAYEDFLKKYPVCEYSELAKQSIEQLEFSNAKQVNTIQAYESFLSRNGKSKYSTDAKKNLDDLYTEKDWQTAIKSNTIDSFDLFINNHPTAKNINEAKQNLEKLEWQNAKAINTAICFEQFIKKYPTSSFISEAKKNIEAFDWKSTQTIGTVDAIKSFLNKYPESSHVKEAKATLNELTTPLLVKAASKNDLEQVKLLLSKKENVNSHSDGGPSALMFASYNNNIEMVKLLVAKGADINYRAGSESAIYLSDIGNWYSDSKTYHSVIVDYLVNSALKLEGQRSPTLEDIRNLVWYEKEFYQFGEARIEILTALRNQTNKSIIVITGEVSSYGESSKYVLGTWQLDISPEGNKWKASVKHTD